MWLNKLREAYVEEGGMKNCENSSITIVYRFAFRNQEKNQKSEFVTKIFFCTQNGERKCLVNVGVLTAPGALDPGLPLENLKKF